MTDSKEKEKQRDELLSTMEGRRNNIRRHKMRRIIGKINKDETKRRKRSRSKRGRQMEREGMRKGNEKRKNRKKRGR